MNVWGCMVLTAALALPVLATSTGPPVLRTGAGVDGGLNCTACHRSFAANSDVRGSISVDAVTYRPGVRQVIRVTVQHPDALRWGFQLTARVAGSETTPAGSFTANDNIRVRCAPDGRDAPCGTDRQFASHRAPSSLMGSNGRGVFEVEWTPPAEDVGDVTFYFAGNAANNAAGNAGDLIFTGSKVVRNADGCNLTAAPAVNGVGNAASGAAGLASGGLFSLFGTGFSVAGRQRSATQADLGGGKFPDQMECVAVTVGGTRVPITFVSAGQINAQAPLNAPASAPVRVVLNPGTPREQQSAVSNAAFSATQPAFFTFNGTSVAAVDNATGTLIAPTSVAASARAARAGDIVALYLTGLGLTNPIWQPGELPTDPASISPAPTVQIGSVTLAAADVLYAGVAPGSISGLMQVNVRIPAGIAAGNAPITVRVGGASTQNGATLPVQ